MLSDLIDALPTLDAVVQRRERLAAIQHDIWRDDLRTLFSFSTLAPNGSMVIPADLVEFLLERMTCAYDELQARDQESARLDVRRLEVAL